MALTNEDLLAISQLLDAKLEPITVRLDLIENDLQALEQKLTDTRLHIENATDKNIQLLAENFVELTKKLNQAIPAADKNLAYEVKVNYLIEEVNRLKRKIEELEAKTA